MSTSKVLKPRRGSTTEHATFKGQAFEITFDTDKKTIVAHDGLTMGGFPLAHEAAVAETDEALRALIEQKVSEVEGVSSSELRALENALRGLINSNAQQQAARDADQDNVVTALDAALRALIAQEVAKYLPLAGGMLTGRLINRAVDNSYIFIAGGTGDTVTPKSGHIIVYGKDHAYSPGHVVLAADNGVDSYKLSIKPDGTVTAGNYNVLTSGGGNLEGDLSFTQETASIYKNIKTGRLVLRGGTVNFADGASLYLYGADSAEQGEFRLYAHDGSVSRALIGKSSSVLTWNGTPVITQTAQNAASTPGTYVKYSNGLIIQWGSEMFETGAVKTLPTPFSGVHSIVALHQGSANIDVQINDMTSTTFTVRHSYNQAVNIMWIAIGF